MFSLSLWGCATITKLARPVAPRHPHACAVVTGQGYSQDPGSYKCGVRRSCSGRGAYGLSPFAPLCGNINKTELPVSLVAGPRQAHRPRARRRIADNRLPVIPRGHMSGGRRLPLGYSRSVKPNVNTAIDNSYVRYPVRPGSYPRTHAATYTVRDVIVA